MIASYSLNLWDSAKIQHFSETFTTHTIKSYFHKACYLFLLGGCWILLPCNQLPRQGYLFSAPPLTSYIILLRSSAIEHRD